MPISLKELSLSDSPTLGELLAQCLGNRSTAPAIVDGDRETTYAELREEVACLLAAFAKLDIVAGVRIGVAIPMSRDFISIYVASHIAGVAFADIPPTLSDDIIEHRIQSARLTVLFYDEKIYSPERVRRLGTLPGLRLVPLGETAGLRSLVASVDPAEIEPVAPVAVAAINYSGGSTGLPKPEAFDGAASGALPMMMLASAPFPETPITVAYRTSAPVMACTVVPALLRGGFVVTLPDHGLDLLVAACKRYRANLMFLATRSLGVLAEREDAAELRTSLRLIFHGGDHLAPAHVTALLEKFGQVFVQFYGCSEAGPAVILTPGDHDPSRPDVLRSVGNAMIGARVEVRAPDGSALPRGAVGEIVIRSAAMMTEYIGLPDKTAETLQGGWLKTGDAGWIDLEGYVHIVDRMSNAIAAEGKLLYPARIDALICEHPAIEGSITLGVDLGGRSRAVASVVLKERHSVSCELLMLQLPDTWRNDVSILIIDAFPLLPAQLKVDRLALRTLAQAHLDEMA